MHYWTYPYSFKSKWALLLSTCGYSRCNGSCNHLDYASGRICALNKTKNAFNMITKIKEWKTLIKHILCCRKCKFDCWKRNSNQKWNKNKMSMSVLKSNETLCMWKNMYLES